MHFFIEYHSILKCRRACINCTIFSFSYKARTHSQAQHECSLSNSLSNAHSYTRCEYDKSFEEFITATNSVDDDELII